MVDAHGILPPIPLGSSVWEFDPDLWPSDDCVATGADLEPETVIEAYRKGAFPMPDGGRILWWSPLERGVFGPGRLKVSSSLRRSAKRFHITVDTAFSEVIEACADPRRPGSWIDTAVREAYERLHRLGWAHSIETRNSDGDIVGGLYGLSIGTLFAGESMFHHERDASKVALMGLVDMMGRADDWLIDTQWLTPHLASLGARSVSRDEYLAMIERHVDAPSPFLAFLQRAGGRSSDD